MTLAVKEMMGRSLHNNYFSLVWLNTKCVIKSWLPIQSTSVLTPVVSIYKLEAMNHTMSIQ